MLKTYVVNNDDKSVALLNGMGRSEWLCRPEVGSAVIYCMLFINSSSTYSFVQR